jgi:hypothetical protein
MKLCLTRLDPNTLDVLGGGGGLRVEDADDVLTFDGGNALLLVADGEGATNTTWTTESGALAGRVVRKWSLAATYVDAVAPQATQSAHCAAMKAEATPSV